MSESVQCSSVYSNIKCVCVCVLFCTVELYCAVQFMVALHIILQWYVCKYRRMHCTVELYAVPKQPSCKKRRGQECSVTDFGI